MELWRSSEIERQLRALPSFQEALKKISESITTKKSGPPSTCVKDMDEMKCLPQASSQWGECDT